NCIAFGQSSAIRRNGFPVRGKDCATDQGIRRKEISLSRKILGPRALSDLREAQFSPMIRITGGLRISIWGFVVRSSMLFAARSALAAFALSLMAVPAWAVP